MNEDEAGGYLLPDPGTAVGPRTLLHAVLSAVSLIPTSSDRVDAGDKVTASLKQFFHARVVPDLPRVIYDTDTGRFFMSAVSSVHVYLAVSRTSTPRDLTTDWCTYEINTALDPFGRTDLTHIGVSPQWLILTSNAFDSKTGFYLGPWVRVFNKPSIADNASGCPPPRFDTRFIPVDKEGLRSTRAFST